MRIDLDFIRFAGFEDVVTETGLCLREHFGSAMNSKRRFRRAACQKNEQEGEKQKARDQSMTLHAFAMGKDEMRMWIWK
jgi:hypothetical protein